MNAESDLIFDGNLGVGETSPARKLHVTSSQIIVARFESTNGTSFSRIVVPNTVSSTPYFGSFEDEIRINGDSHVFENGATEYARFNSSGALGIGTTNPSEKLEVNGNVKATAFQGDGSALTNLPAGGASYLTTSTATTTTQFNPTSSFSTMLTRTFTIPAGKTATVIASAGSHGMWEGASGQMEGRITLSGASSQTGSSVGGHRGTFSNYAGEFSVSQGFRITTSGSHTINYQVRVYNGQIRINDTDGEASYLTITVFQE